MSLYDLRKDKDIRYVKGGRKLGVYNGDIKTGSYIDVNGEFINKDGFALTEDGYIKFDKDGAPITGATPSYIPIDQYEPDGNPWLSEYEKRKENRYRNSDYINARDDLLITNYFNMFKIRLDVPDELILSPNGFIKCWKHYNQVCSTVQVTWGDVFRTGDL